MQKNLPIYEYVLLDDAGGIEMTSFVSEAAMLETFVALSADAPVVQLSKDPLKYELTAPLIVPERLIYRNSLNGQPGYAKFSVGETARIRQQFLRSGTINLANTEHDRSQPVNAQLVELWLIEDPARDKAAALGFKNLPKGTLMATYHVKDKQYWADYVETGAVTGFSLEGHFGLAKVSMTKEKTLGTLLDDILQDLRELPK